MILSLFDIYIIQSYLLSCPPPPPPPRTVDTNYYVYITPIVPNMIFFLQICVIDLFVNSIQSTFIIYFVNWDVEC